MTTQIGALHPTELHGQRFRNIQLKSYLVNHEISRKLLGRDGYKLDIQTITLWSLQQDAL